MAVLLGQSQQATVLGHVVVVGVRVGRMRMGRVRVGTIVRGCCVRHPRIGSVAGVRRGAVQVANLPKRERERGRDCDQSIVNYNLFRLFASLPR